MPADPAKRIEARAAIDAGEIRLSGEVKLTLTVEGPGPLSVTPSKPLLTKPNLWRCARMGCRYAKSSPAVANDGRKPTACRRSFPVDRRLRSAS